MWAMMPIFRILSSGVCRGISSYLYGHATGVPLPAKTRGDQDAHRVGRSRSAVTGPPSGASGAGSLRSGSRDCLFRRFPPVMREGAVRLRHPVRVFLLLYGLAFALRRQNQLGGEAFGHRLLFARAAVLDDPAHPQRRAPLGMRWIIQ